MIPLEELVTCYNCISCKKFFYTESEDAPKLCPHCGSTDIEETSIQ